MKESFDQCTIKNRKFALGHTFLAEIYGGGGGRGEGLSETQGAGALEAGKKCSAVGINKSCLLLNTRELASCG